MRQINVAVRNRVAEYICGERYVCGNNDYAIAFDFDTEWAAYDTKTARFVTGRRYLDVVFNGDVCPVPVLNNVTMFKVGVFAGDIRTTTPAQVPALKSILDDGCAPLPPPTDVYAQIMEQLNTLASRVDEGQEALGEVEITDDELLEIMLAADVLPCLMDEADRVLTEDGGAILLM